MERHARVQCGTSGCSTNLGWTMKHMAWSPRSPETKTPDFRVLNSSGAVPVLDEDGFVLSESMAINFDLAKK